MPWSYCVETAPTHGAAATSHIVKCMNLSATDPSAQTWLQFPIKHASAMFFATASPSLLRFSGRRSRSRHGALHNSHVIPFDSEDQQSIWSIPAQFTGCLTILQRQKESKQHPQERYSHWKESFQLHMPFHCCMQKQPGIAHRYKIRLRIITAFPSIRTPVGFVPHAMAGLRFTSNFLSRRFCAHLYRIQQSLMIAFMASILHLISFARAI